VFQGNPCESAYMKPYYGFMEEEDKPHAGGRGPGKDAMGEWSLWAPTSLGRGVLRKGVSGGATAPKGGRVLLLRQVHFPLAKE